MKLRVLVLPLAGVIIIALCLYKQSQPRQSVAARSQNYQFLQLPPTFVLFDHQNRSVKLKRYLGRHEILIVFFPTTLIKTETGQQVEMNTLLQSFLDRVEQIESRNMILIGVTTALPQHNRQVLEKNEIESRSVVILSDLLGDVHEMWGCWNKQQQRPTEAVFFIDRAGRVLHNEKGPLPLENPIAFLDEKLN